MSKLHESLIIVPEFPDAEVSPDGRTIFNACTVLVPQVFIRDKNQSGFRRMCGELSDGMQLAPLPHVDAAPVVMTFTPVEKEAGHAAVLLLEPLASGDVCADCFSMVDGKAVWTQRVKRDTDTSYQLDEGDTVIFGWIPKDRKLRPELVGDSESLLGQYQRLQRAVREPSGARSGRLSLRRLLGRDR